LPLALVDVLWAAALPDELLDDDDDDELEEELVVVVVAALPVGVEPLLVLVVTPAAPDEVEVQTTLLGTLTWLAWQSCWA
jgi:hypothetical protein